MIDGGERLEARISTHLRDCLVHKAFRDRMSLSDTVATLLCVALKLDPAKGLVPKRPPGLPPRVRHQEQKGGDE